MQQRIHFKLVCFIETLMVKLHSFSLFSSPKNLITFGKIVKALRQQFFRMHILYILLSSLKNLFLGVCKKVSSFNILL